MLRRYVGLMVFVLAVVMLMPMAGMAEATTAAPAADTGGAVVEIPGVEVGEPLRLRGRIWRLSPARRRLHFWWCNS